MREVVRVARVQREAPRHRDGGDQRIIGSGLGLAARFTQRSGDAPERAGGRIIERDGLEIGLGLLQDRLSG